MRKAFITAATALVALCAVAQTETRTITDVINDGEGAVTVVQTAAIDKLLVPRTDVLPETSDQRAYKGTGFRIEVYSDNNVRTAKATAEARKRAVEERFGIQGYLSFHSPYWILRVGDYRTAAEAEKMLGEIKAAFPQYATDLRLVRERVNINAQSE